MAKSVTDAGVRTPRRCTPRLPGCWPRVPGQDVIDDDQDGVAEGNQRVDQRLVRRLERLGYTVSLQSPTLELTLAA